MAVAYRSSSGTVYGSRTNTTLTAPAGIQNGDILVIHFCLGNASSPGTVTPPSGFVVVPGPTFPVSDGLSGTFEVYNWTWYKVANNESGNYTITHATNNTTGFIGAYSGGDIVTPFGQNETSNPQNFVGTINTAVQSSTTATSITTTRNGCMIIFVSQDFGDLTDTLSGPSGFTTRYNVNTGILLVADEQQATAGATGSKTTANNSAMDSGGTPTTNSDAWAGFLIAIQPTVPTTLSPPQKQWAWVPNAPALNSALQTVLKQWQWVGNAPTIGTSSTLQTVQKAWAWVANAPTINTVIAVVQKQWAWLAHAPELNTALATVQKQWAWVAHAPAIAHALATVQKQWVWLAQAPTLIPSTILNPPKALWAWVARAAILSGGNIPGRIKAAYNVIVPTMWGVIRGETRDPMY